MDVAWPEHDPVSVSRSTTALPPLAVEMGFTPVVNPSLTYTII